MTEKIRLRSQARSGHSRPQFYSRKGGSGDENVARPNDIPVLNGCVNTID